MCRLAANLPASMTRDDAPNPTLAKIRKATGLYHTNIEAAVEDLLAIIEGQKEELKKLGEKLDQ